MSYTINPNAKNKWARNAENTMDLSIETDASSVYLDNGRTLEQEIGEDSMVSNVATVDTSMSKIIDGTLDGAYESCVFKGKSLVNIHPISYAISASSATTYFAGRDIDKTKIKSGTRYFLRLLDTDPTVCRAYFKPCNVNTISFADINDKYAIFTTKSELTDSDFSNNKIHFYTSTSKTLEDVANTKIILCEYQEGMENWDIPFFTGLCDVKMPILRNVGKNLFDGEVEIGGITNETGLLNNKTELLRSKNPIRVNENTAYVLSNDKKYNNYVYFYSDDDRFISYLAGRENPFRFTTPSNTHHVRFRTTETESQKDLTIKWQLEESSTATTYEDHKTNILRTSEEIVLREVNGVQDTYNPLTGEYVKRIGEKVLCGETVEDWRDFRNTFIEKTETIDVYLINPEQKSNSNLLCDKMRTTSKGTYMNDEEGISCSGGSGLNVWVSISKNKLSTPNKEGFKQWLQSNPMTIQYELAEPIATIVEPSTIPFAYENGHIILESGSEEQSLLPTLEYSTVVNRAGQVESVAKVIQKQEKQLTMLEKMLIQNIINLDYNNTLLALKK